jgi:hypothetical protein
MRSEGCIYSDRWPHQRFSPSRLVGERGPWGSVWPENVQKTGVGPLARCGFPVVTAGAEQVERRRRMTWSQARSEVLVPYSQSSDSITLRARARGSTRDKERCSAESSERSSLTTTPEPRRDRLGSLPTPHPRFPPPSIPTIGELLAAGQTHHAESVTLFDRWRESKRVRVAWRCDELPPRAIGR